MSNINHWLKDLGLEKYIPLFIEQEIDETVLAELSEQDLEKLGLPLGPRKRYLEPSKAYRHHQWNLLILKTIHP